MKYVDELIEIGLGNVIDMNVDKVIIDDEYYQENVETSIKILNKFVESLSKEQKDLFDDYVSCIMLANERACSLSYLVGVKNAIRFLAEMDAIK